MPFWLMFIPVVAIVQGIIILFVAFGQWVTGTYYAMTPHDGGHGGRIEITRDASPRGVLKIEARLDDGRVFRASFDAGSRRAIVRGLPSRRGRGVESPAVAIELVASDGNTLSCSFTRTDGESGGGCMTAEGRRFDLVARENRPDATLPPRG
jgi:hypothetical protein